MSYTVQQLQEFDGSKSEDSPIYVSLVGNIFDMASHPSGRSFYGPSGGYNIFAGHDVTFSLASMSFNSNSLDKSPSSWKELTTRQIEILTGWVEKFKSKYSIVGKVDFENDNENILRDEWAERLKF